MKVSKLFLYIPIAMLSACVDAPNSADEAEKNPAQEIMDEAEKNPAQEIVDKAIAAMEGDLLDNAYVTFTFRNRDYVFWQKGGQYKYTRILVDTSGTRTVDILTNDGLTRLINDVLVKPDKIWTQRFSNSVNSVFYFAFLPYRLNDPAVIKTYNGLREINGKNYHEVEVQFAKESGGVDHDDNFLYWFDEDNLALDYLAYDYLTSGGGVRFRQALNRRKTNGLIVQDYINYKPMDKTTNLQGMLEAYKGGELEELSRIELVNMQVQKLQSE
jgi:uncharacterized protein DUF6503